MGDSTESKKSSKNICFPISVWGEILSYLPVRSIVRFRLVCKAWKSLIEKPGFSNLHRSHSSLINNLLESHLIILFAQQNGFENYSSKKPFICSANTLEETPSILTSFFEENKVFKNLPAMVRKYMPWEPMDALEEHGVILLRRRLLMMPYNMVDEIVLWNPSICKLVPLPPTSVTKTYDTAVLSVGYDPSSNNYKVVKVNTVYSNSIPREAGEVCCVSVDKVHNRSWSAISCNSSHYFPDADRNKVRFKGAVHWIVKNDRSLACHYSLASFDLNSEVLGSTNLPSSWVTSQVCYMYPAVLKDATSLSVFVANITPFTTPVVVYVLEEHPSSSSGICCKKWTKRYEIDLYKEYIRNDPPFYLKKDGEIIMGDRQNCYNLVTGCPKKPRRMWLFPWIGLYKESLALINLCNKFT